MFKLYLFLLLSPPLILAGLFFIFSGKHKVDEEGIKARLCRFVFYIQFFMSAFALFLFSNNEVIYIPFVHLSHYHYTLMFSIKPLFIFLALIFSLLFILVEKLSYHYLHAEEEHAKFYTLKLFLNFSTMAFLFSSNIDFLFFSWEIIGLTSALLIAYFYRRNQAVEHSLFAFSIYRFCDAAFLLSGLILYYFYHTENIEIVGGGVAASILGILFFIAIMGKSGIYPFNSWLPLALEGPTPSSNMYYMVVSTHMGAIFLLKTYGLWQSSLLVKIVIVLVAMVNMIITIKCAKVQTSIKGALAYSALAQVSLILIEIALGYHTLAVVHLGLHVFYRFGQMTNSPSIIDQHNLIERYSLDNLNHNEKKSFYYLGLHGFKSEIIVLKLFKYILTPIVLIDKLENKIFSLESELK